VGLKPWFSHPYPDKCDRPKAGVLRQVYDSAPIAVQNPGFSGCLILAEIALYSNQIFVAGWDWRPLRYLRSSARLSVCIHEFQPQSSQTQFPLSPMRQSKTMVQHWLQRCIPVWIGLAGWSAIAPAALAQEVTPDSTLGTIVTPSPNGSTFTITGGTPSSNGLNLFHSFSQFSVPNGGAAIFNNASDVVNIFSRVTGGSVSTIDGIIRANGGANLFLMNPNGIIFGRNASLNVGGSFVATTANSFQFPDGSEFSATNPQAPPLLTVNITPGLQYGGNPSRPNPGEIRVERSTLQVDPGKTLALIGGNVEINGGTIRAQGGRVELGGLSGSGAVEVDSNGRFVFPNASPRADVRLNNGSSVNVSAAGGGDIAINAQKIEIQNRSGLLAGIDRNLGTVNLSAGDIILNATDSIDIQSGGVFNVLDSGSQGNSGNIVIKTGKLAIAGNSQLGTGMFGQGKAGSFEIEARDSISLNQNSGLFTAIQNGGNGKGGDLYIKTGNLTITDDSKLAGGIQPGGKGQAGAIRVDADKIVIIGRKGSNLTSAGILNSIEQGGSGQGGDIDLTVGSLTISSEGRLSTGVRGQGTAGNIIVKATDLIELNESGIASNVDITGIGQGGTIKLLTGSLNLNDSQIISIVRGKGNAGDIIINAQDKTSLQSQSLNGISVISTRVAQSGDGEAGNISLTTGSLTMSNLTVIESLTDGKGNAGDISIESRDSIFITGEFSGINARVTSTGLGNGGNIYVAASNLSLLSGGRLTSSTEGKGNAGDITVQVKDQLSLGGTTSIQSGGIFTSVATLGVGEGGDIKISTGSLSITEDAVISATTQGKGNAGSVSITARTSIFLNGQGSGNGDSGAIFSSVGTGGNGRAGNIDITTDSLELINGAQLLSSTQGLGDAGNISIHANDFVSLRDASNNGSPSAVISAVRTGGEGKGGNIFVTTGSLSVSNEAGLIASTDGKGDAGNITVKARNNISINGRAGVFSSVVSGATGIGGNIRLTTDTLQLTNGAQLNSSFFGQKGAAGNISVDARSIKLNKGSMTSITASGDGGDITLNVRDLLLLRRESLISTTAGTAQQGGNGGSITINAPNGFLVSAPHENSDIIANAFRGKGGEVTISALGIYWFNPLSRENLARLSAKLDPRELPTNDITAISQENPNLSGVVAINTLGLDPSGGLLQLPTGLVDPSNKVDQRCAPKGAGRASTFTATGTGGIAASPTEPLVQQGAVMELVPLPEDGNGLRADEPDKRTAPSAAPIVEAQGWIVDRDGTVHLVADARVGIPQSPTLVHPNCQLR
jgi:filamentous hemagglutinin family protein